jgi:acyl-CoA hydrolase
MTSETEEKKQTLAGKLSSVSRVVLSQLMNPNHANTHGNVHGGWIMKLIDEAGALACMRHSQQRVVTIFVDHMIFREPILIGDLVTLTAEVSYVGNTSMEVYVSVEAENPITGVSTHTNHAYLVYVALDERGRPVPVQPVIPETDEQRKRLEGGKKRQEFRKVQRSDHGG